MKTKVRMPEARDRRWKSWRKKLDGVDREKTNGYAFQGEWLPVGRLTELEVGDLVLIYDEAGSVRRHHPFVEICRVRADGDLEKVAEAEGWDWALKLRDVAAELLGEERKPLAEISDDEILAEARRRGLIA